MNLRLWLSEQGLSVRELAVQMQVAPKTVQDRVYERVRPKWIASRSGTLEPGVLFQSRYEEVRRVGKR